MKNRILKAIKSLFEMSGALVATLVLFLGWFLIPVLIPYFIYKKLTEKRKDKK